MDFYTPEKVFAGWMNRNPICTSPADTDFYKLTMGQIIRHRDMGFTDVNARFDFMNRDPSMRLADIICIDELREQLNWAREAKFSPVEIAAIRGTPTSPLEDRRMFSLWYANDLRDYRFPEFELSENKEAGQLSLHTYGPYADVSLWEIPFLSIIAEKHYEGVWRKLFEEGYSRRRFAAFYHQMFARFVKNVDLLGKHPHITLAEMGTRRRHSKFTQWQNYEYMKSELPNQVVGTSNVQLSIVQGDTNAIGTVAHEMYMVQAALAATGTDQELRQSPYNVVRKFAEMYPEIPIGLPDTYGTTAFLKNCPDDVAHMMTGLRSDSKEPIAAVKEFSDWWNERNIPKEKRFAIFSDGLDIPKIIQNDGPIRQKTERYSNGVGTMITNDCEGLINDPRMRKVNIVAKVTKAGRQGEELQDCVKLSDVFAKRTGSETEVKRYEKAFGTEGHV